MGHALANTTFVSLRISILTVSDTRGLEQDGSGDILRLSVINADHELVVRSIVPDDIYRLRATVSQWVAQPDIQVILVNGGTGFTVRDTTPEALMPLFDRVIDGYGELFRYLSYESIGASTIQSSALAGVANRTLIFSMQGSPKACATAWDGILAGQLDARTRPCNFVAMVLPEHDPCMTRQASSEALVGGLTEQEATP